MHATDTPAVWAAIDALVHGRNRDPFALLGVHSATDGRVVRTFQPHAERVEVIDRAGVVVATLDKLHRDGLFAGELPPRLRHYRFRLCLFDGTTVDLEDPYRFGSTLGDLDLYLLGEGSDLRIYQKLGARIMTLAGVQGTRFAVWAPNASRVSVIGDFNHWDGRCHSMRLHPANGIWEIFLPEVAAGARYKYELLDQHGHLLPLKTDPYSNFHEAPPGNASIVYESQFKWRDADWLGRRSVSPELDAPISIYEVHLGSWRRQHGDQYLSYRQLATELVDYVRDMGFTHIEFLPVTEHPFDGSWGYQPIGMFAPTQRFGEPDDFRHLVDCCHAAGIGVIVDWVPAHFPKDEHGLRRFDGTALYEHEDPRKGEHTDWGTLIFNFGRREVVNYLIGNALYWIDEFHVDAIRVDAVASMLYLDYSRKAGQWLPNEHGGRENLEAVAFLHRLNREVHAHGATSFAEESTAWPGVSRPVEMGGLGFTYKWNMGWMNDTLSYMGEDPVHRKHHHDKMTFGLVYAFNENFVLPLSHDEVVHGKRSLLGRMPGDEWQRFANLRAYLANMYAHPGKKLLFMGSELAPYQEWNHDQSLDWHLLDYAPHRGVQSLVRDLNHLYRRQTALHTRDFEAAGFDWIDWNDRDNSVLSWVRYDHQGHAVICITNFTPIVRHDYHIGVSAVGDYYELLNTDACIYGGSGIHNPGLRSVPEAWQGNPCSLWITIPPLATLIIAAT